MYQSNRRFPPGGGGQHPRYLNFWKIYVQIPPSPGQKAIQMLSIDPFQVIKNAIFLRMCSNYKSAD